MPSGAAKSAAFFLLITNVVLYVIVISVSTWAVNLGIERSHETGAPAQSLTLCPATLYFFAASVLSTPARIFPIYFPLGNMATGFVVVFSLIAGVAGLTTSITGILNVVKWDAPNLYAAAASSLITWSLTLLAMGLACKEIELGRAERNLRSLEVVLMILSGTQLLCTGAIHAGVEDVTAADKIYGGRV